MSVSEQNIARHNKVQLDYFSKSIKKTMVPVASPYVLRHVDHVLKMVRPAPSDIVLDVGCGMGKYTLEMARRGVRLEGIDLSPYLLERFREFNAGRYDIPLHASDILPFSKNRRDAFDAVVGFFVLHHIHDIPAAISACYETLKRGGRVCFLEPNPFNVLYYLQIQLTPGMTWQGDGGIVRMRRALIAQAMEESGFVDFRLERFGFFPRFITNVPHVGVALESLFEKNPIWRFALPFQLFTARKP